MILHNPYKKKKSQTAPHHLTFFYLQIACLVASTNTRFPTDNTGNTGRKPNTETGAETTGDTHCFATSEQSKENGFCFSSKNPDSAFGFHGFFRFPMIHHLKNNLICLCQ